MSRPATRAESLAVAMDLAEEEGDYTPELAERVARALPRLGLADRLVGAWHIEHESVAGWAADLGLDTKEVRRDLNGTEIAAVFEVEQGRWVGTVFEAGASTRNDHFGSAGVARAWCDALLRRKRPELVLFGSAL